MCRCVEVCRGLSRSVESSCRAVELSSNVELMNSCLAVEPGNAYALVCSEKASHDRISEDHDDAIVTVSGAKIS